MQYQLMEEQYVTGYKLKIFKVVFYVHSQRPHDSTVFVVVLYFDQLYI